MTNSLLSIKKDKTISDREWLISLIQRKTLREIAECLPNPLSRQRVAQILRSYGIVRSERTRRRLESDIRNALKLGRTPSQVARMFRVRKSIVEEIANYRDVPVAKSEITKAVFRKHPKHDAIVAAATNGLSVVEMMEKLHEPRHRIYSVLSKAGINVPLSAPKFSDAIRNAVKKQLQRGYRISEIAKVYGMSESMVGVIARSIGVQPVRGPMRREEKSLIRDVLFAQNRSLSELSEELLLPSQEVLRLRESLRKTKCLSHEKSETPRNRTPRIDELDTSKKQSVRVLQA